jgi:hypothetical protein
MHEVRDVMAQCVMQVPKPATHHPPLKVGFCSEVGLWLSTTESKSADSDAVDIRKVHLRLCATLRLNLASVPCFTAHFSHSLAESDLENTG